MLIALLKRVPEQWLTMINIRAAGAANGNDHSGDYDDSGDGALEIDSSKPSALVWFMD